MDKIRRIIQIGAYDTTNDTWSNEASNTYVFFEDEAIAPLVLEGEEAYQAFEALAVEQGIDLTDNGNQPIYNEDKNVLIVFNGEIYNYKVLKEELSNKGHKFTTNILLSSLYIG